MRFFIVALAALIMLTSLSPSYAQQTVASSAPAPAAEAPLTLSTKGVYTFQYQDENKWVAADENAPLQAFLKAAEAGKHNHFLVVLPAESATPRALSISRLHILRDILLKNIQPQGLLIEEKDGLAPPNSLMFKIKTK